MKKCDKCDGVGYVSKCCSGMLINKRDSEIRTDMVTGESYTHPLAGVKFIQCKKCGRICKKVVCGGCNGDGKV